MTEPILRRVTSDDLSLIQQVGRDTYVPYYPHVWHPGGVEWYVDICFNTERLEQELANPAIEYYFPMTAEGQVIGLLKLHTNEPTPDEGIERAIFIEKIYLMPDFFGKGMGQKILQIVEDRARAEGIEALWLQVMHNAGPIGAYAKAGFLITAPIHFDYPLLLEEERDGWVMVKKLTDSL